MNLPIEIVINSADIDYVTATWKDLQLVNGTFTIGERYSFPWKKTFAKEKTAFNAEVVADWDVTVSGSVAGTEYYFYISQWIDGTLEQHRISAVGGASDTLTAAAIVSAIETMAAAGGGSRLKVSATNAAGVVTILSDAGYPTVTVSNASSSVLTIAVQTAGEEAINAGADLLAAGVKDSFDGSLPVSGSNYTSYELTLMLPKGNGGFNEQTSDQEHTLMIYIDESGTPSSHWRADFDLLLNGEDATNNTDADASDLLAL